MGRWRRLFRSAEAIDLENRIYELFLADVGHIVEGIFEWWPSPYNPDSPQGTSSQHARENIICSSRKYVHSAARIQCREIWMCAFVYIVGWDHHTHTSLTVSVDWQRYVQDQKGVLTDSTCNPMPKSALQWPRCARPALPKMPVHHSGGRAAV